MRLFLRFLMATAMAGVLGGCAVATVAGAAAGAAISVGAAVVTTGVKVTGAVVEAGVDAVSGDDEEAEENDD